MAPVRAAAADRDITGGLRKAEREMDMNRTGLEGLTRRPRSILLERIADGGAQQLTGGTSRQVDADVVVLDLQELARQRLS
jgi:hypothetical protein